MRNFTFKVIPDPQGPPNSKTQSNFQPEGNSAWKPDANCPPSPPYSPIAPLPPIEQLPPLEPIAPFMPNLPFPGAFPFPSPQPLIPVLPGYTITPWVAHAYVPWQFYAMVYNPSEALFNGTLFPELNQPQGEYGPCEGPQPCKMVYPRGGALDAQ